MTPLGIDPGTVRLVAQHINHYATPGPMKREKAADYEDGTYIRLNDPDGTGFSNYNAENTPVKASQPRPVQHLHRPRAASHNDNNVQASSCNYIHICAVDTPLNVNAQTQFHINLYASLLFRHIFLLQKF